jgi:hypothetical protein
MVQRGVLVFQAPHLGLISGIKDPHMDSRSVRRGQQVLELASSCRTICSLTSTTLKHLLFDEQSAICCGDSVDSYRELPLGHPASIAVDADGNIYCGLQFYGRVQKYDSRGQFIKGWFISASGGRFRLRVNEANQLEVATTRKATLFRFDTNGELLEQRGSPGIYTAFNSDTDRSAEHNDALFTIVNPLMFPAIIRTSRDGIRSEVVVRQSLFYWILMGPFPAWLFLTIGVFATAATRVSSTRRGLLSSTQSPGRIK